MKLSKTIQFNLFNRYGNRNRVSKGNSKTGFKSINLLAGDRESEYSGYMPHDITEKVCGSCTGNCPGCYAKKLTRYSNVYRMYASNTIEALYNPVKFWELVEQELYYTKTGKPKKNPVKVVRIHDSGDLISYDYYVALVAFVKRHPETIFYTYTKEADILKTYGLNNIPKNLTINCSPWPGYCEPIGDLPQFIYDDGSDPGLVTMRHCPAVDKNGNRTGITCKQCGHCARAKRGEKMAVYAH